MAEMRMAELAAHSGLSVATIKYYLREGLLRPGRRTSVNQAAYDESHLDRLRLIRALAKVAGLSLSAIRDVIRTVDAHPSVLDAMAVTQDALVGVDLETTSVDDAAEVVLDEVIRARGWRVQPGSPAHRAAVEAVAGLRSEELTMVLDHLSDYAAAADAVGRTDVRAVSGAGSLEAMVRGVVLGSVLRRPLLDALVLLAQQHYANELDDGTRPAD